MSFLNPWALAIGLPAVLLPIFVHWLTRPRPLRVDYPTARLVAGIVRQRKARHRLRDWLVLLLRTAAVMLVALALARPFGDQKAVELARGEATVARVVLLDTSLSMAARQGGVSRFETARAVAGRRLAPSRGTSCELVLVGAVPQATLGRTSTNFSALGDTLDAAQVVPERAAVPSALDTAAALLQRTNDRQQLELIIVSDFQRANWAAADFSVLPADVDIRLESVAGPTQLDNLAVLEVAPAGRWQANTAGRLEVDVGNYSRAERTVELRVDLGTEVAQTPVRCPPGISRHVVELTPREPGWLTGTVELVSVEDALPADNTRPAAIEVFQEPRFVILSRQAVDEPYTGGYFVAGALASAAADAGGTSNIVPWSADRSDPGQLAGPDCVVVVKPGNLSDEALSTLAALLMRGKGVLYLASEKIDAANLARLSKILGSAWQPPVEFLPAEGAPAELFLASYERGRPPFSVFGDAATSALSPLRFSTRLQSRKRPEGLSDDVLATLSDRSAALVISGCGAGKVAVWNVDLAESNVALEPAFVPLVWELVGELIAGGSAREAVLCGETSSLYLPPAAIAEEDLKVQVPTGADEAGAELVEDSLGVLLKLSRPAAGLYTVRQGKQTLLAVPSAAPVEESDLESLTPEVIRARLAGNRRIHLRHAGAPERSGDWLWTPLAAACALCLLAELVVLRRFST